jgi:hypothetical protein
MNKREGESIIINSRRIATPITSCVIGVALPLLVRLYVARAEALWMASSVIYLSMRWIIFSFGAFIVLYASFSHVWSSYSIVGMMVLSCFVIVSRSNLLWLVSMYLEAWFNMCTIRPYKRIEWSGSMLCIGLCLNRGCLGIGFPLFSCSLFRLFCRCSCVSVRLNYV